MTERANCPKTVPRKATTTIITNIDPNENDSRKGRRADAGVPMEGFVLFPGPTLIRFILTT